MGRMKIRSLILAGAVLCAAVTTIDAGEKITLMVTSVSGGFADSATTITLNQGDSLELSYASPVTNGMYLVVTIGGKELALQTLITGSVGTITNPVKLAGPAVIKARIGPTTPAQTGLMTVEVTRAGTASSPAAVPLEAGATYNVMLEASSDLVNWTSVSPGDYAADSPQRFFRTRMVKKLP